MGDFTSKLDLAFDATAIFGQPRSKRYALLIEDGEVKEAHVEPDNTGVNGESHHLTRHLLGIAMKSLNGHDWTRHLRLAMYTAVDLARPDAAEQNAFERSLVT